MTQRPDGTPTIGPDVEVHPIQSFMVSRGKTENGPDQVRLAFTRPLEPGSKTKETVVAVEMSPREFVTIVRQLHDRVLPEMTTDQERSR